MSLDLLPPTLQRITRLEAAAADALAPRYEERRDGWRFRLDDTGIRRGNSVLPEGRGRGSLTAKVREVRAFYRANAMPARVQLSAAAAPTDLDARLEASGWIREGGAQVHVRSLAQLPTVDLTLHIAERPDPAWRALQDRVTPGGVVGAEARADALLRAGRTPLHVWAEGTDGRAVAAGLAVVDRSHGTVGLFRLATRPDARRQGFGRRLVAAVLAHAAGAGAQLAYLQVAEDNAAALHLYARLGFREHHRYHYRRAPDDDS